MSEEKNIPPENPKNQITNSKPEENKNISQPEPQPQTTTMEVHKHPHDVTHKKKWPEYLLEFIMIFLAVFLGFLAENRREHIAESNREKQYIQSFYEDLTADEHDLELNINFLKSQMQEADSLQMLMKNISTKQPANRIYMYLRGITRSSRGLLYPNDRTIVQLRNAGGMRLIRNKSVSDSMVGYYRTIDIIKFLQNGDALTTKDRLNQISMPLLNADGFIRIIDSTSTIINPAENLYLRKADPDIINSCLIEINRIKTINSTLSIRIQQLRERAGRIKNFIKREYHLRNE